MPSGLARLRPPRSSSETVVRARPRGGAAAAAHRRRWRRRRLALRQRRRRRRPCRIAGRLRLQSVVIRQLSYSEAPAVLENDRSLQTRSAGTPEVVGRCCRSVHRRGGDGGGDGGGGAGGGCGGDLRTSAVAARAAGGDGGGGVGGGDGGRLAAATAVVGSAAAGSAAGSAAAAPGRHFGGGGLGGMELGGCPSLVRAAAARGGGRRSPAGRSSSGSRRGRRRASEAVVALVEDPEVLVVESAAGVLGDGALHPTAARRARGTHSARPPPEPRAGRTRRRLVHVVPWAELRPSADGTAAARDRSVYVWSSTSHSPALTSASCEQPA